MLMDQEAATDDDDANRTKALERLNRALAREGFTTFYRDDHQCYLRNIRANTVARCRQTLTDILQSLNRRSMRARRLCRQDFRGRANRDVLLPLFRRLVHRVTVAGHKDNTLEYGKTFR